MQPSSRLDRLPLYLFAELERKIREKKAPASTGSAPASATRTPPRPGP